MALLTRDLEPLWIARYNYQPGWRLPAHAHAHYFQLIWIITGEGHALIDGARVPLQPNQLLFLRPGLQHGLETSPHATVRTLDTKFRIHRASLRRACRQLEAVHLHVDRRVSALLEAMHAEADQPGTLVSEISQTLLVHALLLLLRKDAPPSTAKTFPAAGRSDPSDLCDRLGQYLSEHCAEKIDQRTLSDALHYSYRHLHAVWLTRHDESPLQALWKYRVERAKHMIRYSDYELKRVAELSGFLTIHHFTRVFTRIAGTSPARWREQERHSIRRDLVLQPGFVNRPLTIRTPNGH
jgi:AraC-like DNA-binding protein